MAGVGKYLRGRDGRVGGLQLSLGRNSSESLNPSTLTSTRSVSLRTHTHQSFPGRPIPHEFPPPLQASPPPPQAFQQQRQEEENQEQQQQPIMLKDLFRIPGRELYLTILNPIPTEGTTWK